MSNISVASSLESLVLGEGQILGQVRDAYKAADARGRVGPILHNVFQQAIRVGKKVREVTETVDNFLAWDMKPEVRAKLMAGNADRLFKRT